MSHRAIAVFLPMPPDVDYRNGGASTPCDMLVGPCGCGAWHDLDEWYRRTIDGVPVSAIGAVRRAIEGAKGKGE